MIIRQIGDFGRFLNIFCNFGAFLAKNQKYPKNNYFEKVKIEDKKVCFKRLNNLFQISYISFLWYEFYDFLICFVICNVLGNFLPFWLFSRFSIL